MLAQHESRRSSRTVEETETTTKPKQNQELILIHLGKTAGSSITCMLHPSVYASGTGNSGCNATTDYHPRGNAIAQSVAARIHLAAAPVLVRNDHDTTTTDNNTNFLCDGPESRRSDPLVVLLFTSSVSAGQKAASPTGMPRLCQVFSDAGIRSRP